MAARLTTRVLHHLVEAGPVGLTKSDLLRKIGARAVDMNTALESLMNDFSICCITQRERYDLGRVPTRYYHISFAGHLTPPKPDDIPIKNLDSDTEQYHNVCIRCGRATRLPTPYCSPMCKEAAALGCSPLANAVDPAAFGRAAVFWVAADLSLRGFHVAFPFLENLPRLAVLAEDGEIRSLAVMPISLDGYFGADPQEYEAVALVYHDGRIIYGGRVPLVDTSQAEGASPEDVPQEASTEDTPQETSDDQRAPEELGDVDP
jgi:hypothetical protein